MSSARRPFTGERRSDRPSRVRRRLLVLLVLALVVVGLVVWIRRPAEVAVDSYLGDRGEAAVTVRLTTGLGDRVTQGSAVETDDQVTVSVLVRSAGGSRPAVGILEEIRIPLDQPLGGRAVVDAHTGLPLPMARR